MMTTTTTAAVRKNMRVIETTAVGITPRWEQHRFRAMGTDVYLAVYTMRQRPLGRMVEDMFRYFESLLSRFLPNSELSHLNRYDRPDCDASPDLFAAVEAALWAAQQTEGIYDPTILPYLEHAGYSQTFAAMNEVRPLAAAEIPFTAPCEEPLISGPDYRSVSLDRHARVISRPVGLKFDLGGMGKGWTVDRVADELRGEGCFLLNAGGDLFAYGLPGDERGWEIHLTHPFDPAMPLATLRVPNHAVATSTLARRRWEQGGRVRHHLIDPRTGRPAETDVASVSVVGERVFTAEVHAKVALILGLEAGTAYLESLSEVEGLLVTMTGTVVQTSGLASFIAEPAARLVL